jgi:diadenosine tetraphosphate (Ap4A) HIT family hydrolase
VREVWQPPRVGLLVAGFEVPHLHLHVFPAWDMAAFDFANAAKTVDADEQDAHAEKLRAALRALGHGAGVPD